MGRVPLTMPGRSREAELLQRALEGRLPRRQLTPGIGGYAEVADRLSELVPTTSLRPSAEFRAELHERLLELAVARATTLAPATVTEPDAEAESDRRRRLAGLLSLAWLAWFSRGWRRTATAATGALLALSVGVGFASASAVPGGLLYPVKELIQTAQVQLAHGDMARGRVLLDQAGDHIGDARTLVSRGSPEPADIDTALRAAAADLSEAQQRLLTHFSATQDPAALTALARFATAQSPQLAALRGRVPVVSEPLVDQVLAQLGAMSGTVRTLAVQCGSPCASVPVSTLPGPDGLVASISGATNGSGTTSGPTGLTGPDGTGLGGLLGTDGGVPGASSGPVSAGSGGVGVQLPGVGATVPAPGVSVGSGGAHVTVPPVGATVGPITATLPGVGITVPPVLPHSTTHSSAASGSSSSSSVCVLIVCVG